MDIIISIYLIELCEKLKEKNKYHALSTLEYEHYGYTMTGVIIAVITVIRLIISSRTHLTQGGKLSPPWCRLPPPETEVQESRSLANLQPSETTVNWNPGSPSTDNDTPVTDEDQSRTCPARPVGGRRLASVEACLPASTPKVMLQAL